MADSTNGDLTTMTRVVTLGDYYIDIIDSSGGLFESVHFDSGSVDDTLSDDDGVHYYAENTNPPSPTGPAIFRSTVTGGVARDEAWAAAKGTWAETQALIPYRVRYGERMLRAISEQAARALVTNKQILWEATPW